MTDIGDQGNREKSALEVEKLALEKRLLERQLSSAGLLLVWLQAASVPVALFGAILAFFVGFGQLQLGADNQAADRFDKALTRLASKHPDERITGVSGLQLFLNDRNRSQQKQALQFLINGLSLETDMRVRGAILDVLADLPSGGTLQDALDAGLRTAVERNRSLTKSIVDASERRIVEQQRQLLTKFNIAGVEPDSIKNQIPVSVLAALPVEQYLALLDVEHSTFSELAPSEDVPLTGLRTAIHTLVARGATSRDFKQINCENCDFSPSKSLDGVTFEGAYLNGADFARVSLRGASFKDADLGGTNFFGADLTRANLSHSDDWYSPRGLFANRRYFSALPILECTKLKGADLSGQPLIMFVKNFSTLASTNPSYAVLMPRMVSVELDSSTKLDSFSILAEISISDAYLKEHPSAPEVQPLIKDRELYSDAPIAWRSNADYAEDTTKYKHTKLLEFWNIDYDLVEKLGEDDFPLQEFVDQPTLKTFPLYSRFVDTVKALKWPEGEAAKRQQTLRDGLAVNWATMKPLSCTERSPNTGELLIYRDTRIRQ